MVLLIGWLSLRVSTRLDEEDSGLQNSGMRKRKPTNRIQAFLSTMGIDWHSPRYGRPRQPGRPNEIVIKDNNAFGRLIGSLTANGDVDLEPQMPPAIMTGISWEENYGRKDPVDYNLNRIKEHITPYLGEPQRLRTKGVVILKWSDQAGSITVRVKNDAKGRASDGCLIEIIPGWKKPLSTKEKRIIDEMKIIGRGSPRGLRNLLRKSVEEYEDEYVREIIEDHARLDGILGYDAKNRVIVGCPGQLVILNAGEVKSFRHVQGYNGNCSLIQALLHTGQILTLAEHDNVRGLDFIVMHLRKTVEIEVEMIDEKIAI